MYTTVDIRTEFMAVILKLSNYCSKYPELKNLEANKEYNQRIETRFAKYRDDPYIKNINKLIEDERFCYDIPFALALHCFDQEFDRSYPHLSKEQNDLIHTTAGKKFIYNTKEFVEKIGFKDFFSQEESFYSRISRAQRKNLEDEKFTKFYQEFYGITKMPDMYINLILADSSCGGFGLNKYDTVVPSLCVQFKEDGTMYPCAQSFILHEMSHPLINSLTNKYLKNTKIKSSVKHYVSAKSLVNDYIIRATEIIFLKQNNTDSSIIEKRIKREKESEFSSIERVVKLLEIYSQNRDKYKTIEDFYPKLISKLENILVSKQDIKNNGF